MNDFLQKMVCDAEKVMQHSYSPYSQFSVGACIRTIDNEFFVGCNIENASFPLSLCAETVALGQMMSAGYRKIADIVVIAKKQESCTPCGGCRQRLIEFSTQETKVHLCRNGQVQKTILLIALLPEAFILN